MSSSSLQPRPRPVVLDRFRISRGVPNPFVRYQFALRSHPHLQIAAGTLFNAPVRIGEIELWLEVRDRTETTGMRWDPFTIVAVLPDQPWPEEPPFFLLGAQFLECYEVDVMLGSASGGQLLIRGG